MFEIFLSYYAWLWDLAQWTWNEHSVERVTVCIIISAGLGVIIAGINIFINISKNSNSFKRIYSSDNLIHIILYSLYLSIIIPVFSTIGVILGAVVGLMAGLGFPIWFSVVLIIGGLLPGSIIVLSFIVIFFIYRRVRISLAIKGDKVNGHV